MANKLSSRDRELLYTHTDRIIGERPYEAGEFKMQDGDFILFELLDISGRTILHKNLSHAVAYNHTDTHYGLYPAVDIKGAGFKSGTFKVRYQFLRRMAGNDSAVLVHTQGDQKGIIYPKDNEFHITDEGKVYIGTEENYEENDGQVEQLKIESLKYEIEAISPSRTEIRLKAKNIKASDVLGERGSYQSDFRNLQEITRYYNIKEEAGGNTIEFLTGTDSNINLSKILQVTSPTFHAASNGGFNSSMVGGNFIIRNVFKVRESLTKQKSGINAIPNASLEELEFDEMGHLKIGALVSADWNESLHFNAVKAVGWDSGFFPPGDVYEGTGGVGYHAHAVQGEGVNGGVCLKFPDMNADFMGADGWNGEAHRLMKLKTATLPALHGINISAGDIMNISFDLKTTSVTKGVKVYARYAQTVAEEPHPGKALMLDVIKVQEALTNYAEEEHPGDDNPPDGYVANTADEAINKESSPGGAGWNPDESLTTKEEDYFYGYGGSFSSISVGDDSSYYESDESNISGTAHWKIITIEEAGSQSNPYIRFTWTPNLHHPAWSGEFNKAGTVSEGGNYVWDGNQWVGSTSTGEQISATDILESHRITPQFAAPMNPPEGFMIMNQTQIDELIEGSMDIQAPPTSLLEILDMIGGNSNGNQTLHRLENIEAILGADMQIADDGVISPQSVLLTGETTSHTYFTSLGYLPGGLWKIVGPPVSAATVGVEPETFMVKPFTSTYWEGEESRVDVEQINYVFDWVFDPHSLIDGDDVFYNKKGTPAIAPYDTQGDMIEEGSGDGEWVWSGYESSGWIAGYHAPPYAEYVQLSKAFDVDAAWISNAGVANNAVLSPLAPRLSVMYNGVDLIYGQVTDVEGSYTYIDASSGLYLNNGNQETGIHIHFKNISTAYESSVQFRSPGTQWKWDGSEWVNTAGSDLFLDVEGRSGTEVEATPSKVNEWERQDVSFIIPDDWRLDKTWNLGFYGHNVGDEQGVSWVDNIYVDFTFSNTEIVTEYFEPFTSKIKSVQGNGTHIELEDSFTDVRNRIYEVEGVEGIEVPDAWVGDGPTINNPNNFLEADLSYMINNPLDLRTYLKHENELFLTTNFKADVASISSWPHSIVYKLYRPLPTTFRRFDEFTIVKEMMPPLTETVKIVDFIDTDVGDVVLRSPNLEVSNYVENKPTKYETETAILTDDSTISEKLRNEFISQSFQSVEINTDYGQFKNFTNFSSVEKRIRNFKYKLELIESYTESSASLVGISGSLDDLKSWKMKATELKNNFDPFEKYMYHESSSYSSGSLGIFFSNAWPKTGGAGTIRSPYVLAHTTSSTATTWVTAQTVSGSDFDYHNVNKLSNHIPSHISDDSENLDYVNFTDMVAQHFDSIWLYANSITDIFDRRDKLDEGVSKELLYTVAKSLGWEMSNAHDLVSLPRYAYGVEVSGSAFSDYSATADRDISREIWSRIINNMPFFLKNKGTVKALKGLINVYGIPSTILRVKEYGGPDLPDDASPQFEITRKFTKALDFRSGQYIRTAWADDNYTSRKPDTVEFRFRAATGSNQILVQKETTGTDLDWIIRLKDNGSSDDYGRVSFMLSSSAAGTSTGQYKELSSSAMPVYDGDFYSVMVQRSSGSDNPHISQSYELHVGKYDAGRSKIHLYSKSTMAVDLAVSSSFNLAWTGSGDVYIGGRSGSSATGIQFSGSIMEYRHWTETLQTSSFRNHVGNPKAYDGNSISSSYKHLTLRYSFDDNQDLSSYASGILDSRANQQLAVSGSYSGFTGNFYRNVVDELKTHIPSIGALRRSTNKIRIESNIKTGNLNANERVTVGAHDYAPIDSNRAGIYFAPTDVINNDIINSVANLNFDNYLGDPRDLTEHTYRGLEYAANNYWKKYTSPNNFWDYIRILKYYDQSMFKQIKRLIPARVKARVGILIEPNIFERPKIIMGKTPDAENLFFSSSIDIGRTVDSLIVITGSYNVGQAVTHYDAYTSRIDMYSYETGSSVVTISGSISNLEASGSEIRDRFTQGSIWARLNDGKDMFYGTSSITQGDEKYYEVLQPTITGSRVLGRNQKIRKFYSSAASMSLNNYHSSSWKNVDLDNKAEEVQSLFNMYYAGVKNTVRTTVDGRSPVEIVITSPTKLVTQTAGGINLKTGTGIEPVIVKGTKLSGIDRLEQAIDDTVGPVRDANNKKRRKTSASKKVKPTRHGNQGTPPISDDYDDNESPN